MLKIGAEKITKSYENPHPTPHRHNYYELYFLLDGERQVFIEHEMFKLTKNCLAIIPPFHYHKTEGGGYSRINVNIHPEELDDRSCELFMNLTNDKAIVINDTHLEAIHILLEEAVNINTSSMNSEEKADSVLSLFKAIITLLSIQKNKPIQAYSKGKTRKTTANKNTSSEILQIVSYINQNYNKKISLDYLCNKYFISKTAINVKFKEIMQCTVMDYVLTVRLNHAHYLLTNTSRSIEEIAEACGFSSANYFSLIFKKKMGIKPSAKRGRYVHRHDDFLPL